MNTFFEKGWECPKCGAVMSPTTSVCVNCRGVTTETTVITDITPNRTEPSDDRYKSISSDPRLYRNVEVTI